MNVSVGPAVLAIDTATPVVGVGLRTAGGALHLWSERATRGADTLLLPAVERLLAIERPARVVVSVGPGAFTGLRVGVSAAMGLALALGVGLVPVSSLRARVGLGGGAARVLVLLDGRKGRAYSAVSGAGLLPDEVDLPPEEAIARAGGPGFVAVGEGAAVWRALVEQAGGVVVPEADRCPLVELLQLGLEAPELLAPEAVRLNYIRPSDAQLPAR